MTTAGNSVPASPPTPKRRFRRGDNHNPSVPMSAVALARHLDCSRTYIQKLEADGVIHREPGGGFPLDASRVAYLRFLRRQRQQSPKSAAESEFQKAKTRLIQLRIAEREGELMMTDEAVETVEALTGMFRTHTAGLSARCSRDLQVRRTIDAAVFEMLNEIADEAARRGGGFGNGKGDTVNSDDTE